MSGRASRYGTPSRADTRAVTAGLAPRVGSVVIVEGNSSSFGRGLAGTLVVTAGHMADQQVALVARPRPAYAVDAVTHPASKLTLLVGFGMATLLASVTLAAFVMVVAASTAWIVSGSPSVQQYFDQQHLALERRNRLVRRQAALQQAAVEASGLVELSALVDNIEDSDGGWTARRFQLEELIDRYVRVAIAHQRCLHAMQATDRSVLLRSLAATPPSSSPATSRCRRQLLERRIATWDRTALQATRFEDELAAITDLVRLLAQRAACPDALHDADLVEWRLAELDAEDLALHQLSAGTESEAA
jgi:hypothetical protein